MDDSTPSTSEQLVHRVATYTDTSSLELPPLYDTIDPDALDNCIDEMAGVGLSFLYAGVAVTVDSDGDISLDEASAASLCTAAETDTETTE